MVLRVLVAFICALFLLTEAAYSAEDQPRRAIIRTTLGDLILQLDWQHAPQSCATFVRYVKDGVYAQTSFDDADDKAFFGGKPPSRFRAWRVMATWRVTAGPSENLRCLISAALSASGGPSGTVIPRKNRTAHRSTSASKTTQPPMASSRYSR